MDTKAIAVILGTETRILRRFLRDPRSTFQSVGSGARYEFTEADIPELTKRFHDWQGNKQAARVATPTRGPEDNAVFQRNRDEAIWEDEGEVVIPDIRRPGVRAKVKREAERREARLNELLMAAGLHLSQQSYRARMSAAA